MSTVFVMRRMITCIFVVVLSTCGSAYAITPLLLDESLHFTGTAEQDVIVVAGSYLVEPEGEGLRLVPQDGGMVLEIAANQITHREEIHEPIARLIRYDDETMVLLLAFPGELAYQAVGSRSGIRARATIQLSPSAVSSSLGTPIGSFTIQRVTNWMPRGKIVAGERIRFFLNGRVASNTFAATLGGQPLPIVTSSNTANNQGTLIEVQVPLHTIFPSGAELSARVMTLNQVLEPSFKVYERPTVLAMRVLDGPWVGFPETILDVTVGTYRGLEGKEVGLMSRDCWISSARMTTMPVSGLSGTIRMSILFTPRGIVSELPAGSDPTGNLVALSGRSCQLELYLGLVGRIATGKVLTLPAVSSISLATTKELLAFTTPSGKRLRATATGNCGGPLSVGSAGTFAVGVLSSGTDVKFHIRNGIFPSDCHFETTPSLTVKKGWVITEASWNLNTDNDALNHCRLSFGAVHFQLGINSYGADSPHDERTLRALRTSGTCVPDEKDPLRNNHFLSLGLSKLTLVGPVGRSWRDAFE